MLQRTSENVMFSLKPRFIEAFLNGSKTVELRRRPPLLSSGTIVWLYGTVPCGKVMAVARVAHVTVAPTTRIWQQFNRHLSLSKDEFDEYLTDRACAAAIGLEQVTKIESPVALAALRSCEPGFQPPQFFRHVRCGELLDQLQQSQPGH
jgi:predicted transcriptional regulator